MMGMEVMGEVGYCVLCCHCLVNSRSPCLDCRSNPSLTSSCVTVVLGTDGTQAMKELNKTELNEHSTICSL